MHDILYSWHRFSSPYLVAYMRIQYVYLCVCVCVHFQCEFSLKHLDKLFKVIEGNRKSFQQNHYYMVRCSFNRVLNYTRTKFPSTSILQITFPWSVSLRCARVSFLLTVQVFFDIDIDVVVVCAVSCNHHLPM